MQHDEVEPDRASDDPGVTGAAAAERSAADTDETGVRAVDEVLRSVQGLDERPVGEHVQVFERAHEGLRRALDAPDHGDGG